MFDRVINSSLLVLHKVFKSITRVYEKKIDPAVLRCLNGIEYSSTDEVKFVVDSLK